MNMSPDGLPDPEHALRLWQQAQSQESSSNDQRFEPVTHRITYFRGIKPMITGLLFTFITGSNLYMHYGADQRHQRTGGLLFYGAGVLLLALEAFLIAAAAASYFNKSSLRIEQDFLVIKGTKLYPHEINSIMVDGIRNPAIAVKPKGVRITPGRWVFRFQEDESAGLNTLENWAGLHGIQTVNRKFIRWI